MVEVQAGLCGGLSVLCCPSRWTGRVGTRGALGEGGPAYTTLEMGSRRLVEGGEDAVGAGGERRMSGDSAGLIRG